MKGIEHQVQQRTPEWHKLRNECLTGTDAYLVRHNINRAVKAFTKKRQGLDTFAGNAATEYGIEAEPIARNWYEAHIGTQIREVGFVTDEDMPRLGCSPDGLYANDSVLVEIKCPHSAEPPVAPKPEHEDQVRWNMMITGALVGRLIYWTPEVVRLFTIDKDDTWETETITAALRVLKESDEMLAAGGVQEPLLTFREDDSWLNATQSYLDTKEEYERALAAFEEAKKELQFLSDNLDTRGGGVKANWLERSGTVNWPKLAKKYGIPKEEIESYRAPPTRYCRITIDREEE